MPSVLTVNVADVENFISLEKGIRITVGYNNLVFGEAVPGYGKKRSCKARYGAIAKCSPHRLNRHHRLHGLRL
jgi:hypothetical protein